MVGFQPPPPSSFPSSPSPLSFFFIAPPYHITDVCIYTYQNIRLTTAISTKSPQPVIAVQNTLPPAQLSIAMSLIMFSQTFGGAVFLTFADTIFTNSLKAELLRHAPAVDPAVVITAGATAVRQVVAKNELPGVLVAYSASVGRVFYLAAGAGVGCFCFAWGMGWKDIRNTKKKPVVQGGEV